MKNIKPMIRMCTADWAKIEEYHPDTDRTVILICRVEDLPYPLAVAVRYIDGNYIATATDNIIDPPSKAIWIESPSQ
ncbi:MAG: hypothetical protein ACD_84C00042G0002 [uncultured bacterium]|nr:MAG: hypothetical protein ACD_84C00042G0002 [uncultured bacterium]